MQVWQGLPSLGSRAFGFGVAAVLVEVVAIAEHGYGSVAQLRGSVLAVRIRRAAALLSAVALAGFTCAAMAQAANPRNSPGTAASLGPARLIATSTQPLAMVASTNGDAAVLQEGYPRGRVYVWRSGIPGLRLIGRGVVGPVAVVNDGRSAAYKCGATPVLCIWRVGDPIRKVSVPCGPHADSYSPDFMSADLHTLLVDCRPGSDALSLLLQIGPTATEVTRFPGSRAAGLSSDGRVAVLAHNFHTLEIYASGRLQTVPRAQGFDGMSRSGRFLAWSVFGAIPPAGSLQSDTLYLYDRSTGQTSTSTMPAGKRPAQGGGAPFIISNSGETILSEGDTDSSCTIDGFCPSALVNVESGAVVQLTTAGQTATGGGVSSPPLAMSADGTIVFYAVRHFRCVTTCQQGGIGSWAPTGVDRVFVQTVTQ